MLDLLLRNARLRGAESIRDIGVRDGIFVDPTSAEPARETIDLGGRLVTPPLVEPHIHLDAALTVGQPRPNSSGSLFEGIAIWGERVKDLTTDDVKARVRQVLRWQLANGVQHVRSHVDICDPKLTALRALLEVRDEVRDQIDLQLVAFPAETIRRGMSGRVTASHTTAMHSYNAAYAYRLVNNIKRAGLHMVTNPLDNSVLQGRFDTGPVRRGHTRVKQLQQAGVNVCIGHDSVMDPWYPLGFGDPLQAAFVFVHLGHYSGDDELNKLLDMVTGNPASALGLQNGLAAWPAGIHSGRRMGAAGTRAVEETTPDMQQRRSSRRPYGTRHPLPVSRAMRDVRCCSAHFRRAATTCQRDGIFESGNGCGCHCVSARISMIV